MKIETVALEDQQTKLIAELDSDTLEKYKHQAARKISQNAKIPGFRPGKAPYDIIRRMYGDEAIQQEALELMLDDVYPQILQEANINPSGPGKLEEIVKVDPPTFAFIVPLPPTVELGDYREIRKDYAPEPVTDEQVEQTMKRLQRSYSTAEPVERPAQVGDMVAFKLSGKRVSPEEGEDEVLVPETPYQLVAGDEDEENSWPYEGFSNELTGMGADDTKTVRHTFSDDSPFEDLRGKEVEFVVTVQNVKELHLPELTDEFAQNLGEFETLEELRKTVRGQLEQNYSQQYDQNYYDELIGALVEQATIKYPPHMLDEEIEDFIKGVERNLERDRLDLDTYLKMREMDRETFIEQEVKPAASRRLERSLVLEEFARRESVEVNSQEIQSIYYTAMQQMQEASSLSKGVAKNKRNPREMANSLAMNTVNSIFNQRLMTRLKNIAIGKGDEQPESEVSAVSLDEALVDETPAPESTAEEVAAAESASAEVTLMGDADQPSEGETTGADEEPGEKEA